MKKWKKIKTTPPPENGIMFWGYDVWHDAVHVCICHRKEILFYTPFPAEDDYSIEYWIEMEKKPEPPNVCEDEHDKNPKTINGEPYKIVPPTSKDHNAYHNMSKDEPIVKFGQFSKYKKGLI